MATRSIVARFSLRLDRGLSPEEMLRAIDCPDISESLWAHPPWVSKEAEHVTAVLIDMAGPFNFPEVFAAVAELGARVFTDNAALWTLARQEPSFQCYNGVLDPNTLWNHPEAGDCVAVLSGNPDGSRSAGIAPAFNNVWQERCLVLAELVIS